MTPPPQPFVFGYFPRHKYKDLVFYVETGEYSNMGLFEMEDTEENRALMDALSTQSSRDKVLEDVITLLLSSVHPQSNCSKVLREILKNNRLMAELRQAGAP